MSLDIQFKIKNNPQYIKYLREHSYWYKYLNRSPNYFPQFEQELKAKLGIRTQDKIVKMLDTFEMMNMLVSKLK